MKPPEIPNDKERLQNLLSYKVLDTESEQVLDDLTELASQICQTPISAISLLDADRQWFKSVVGLNVKETPREHAFCAHAIAQENLFVVNDTLKDKRFKFNPLVTGDPKIRFYAAVPLKSEGGHNIGTFCVIDKVPRLLNDYQREVLVKLARQVMSQIELRKKVGEVSDLSKVREKLIKKTISYAKEKSNLADQLRQSNEKLKNLNTKAIDLGNVKSQLLANMSHEIRTPLNTILGLVDMMSDTRLDRKQFMYLNKVKESSNHLLSVVNNVLDYSKLEFNKDSKAIKVKVKLNTVVQSLVKMIEAECESKGLVFMSNYDEAEDVYIETDALMLRQILLNLLSNSVKFTNPGGSISFMINMDIEKGQLNFEVKDSGIGMNDNVKKNIFTPFFQGDNSASRKFQGTGVGLTLVKEFTENLGGEINFQSIVAQGTSFNLALPTEITHVNKNDKRNIKPSWAVICQDHLRHKAVSKTLLKYDSQVIMLKKDEPLLIDILSTDGINHIVIDDGDDYFTDEQLGSLLDSLRDIKFIYLGDKEISKYKNIDFIANDLEDLVSYLKKQDFSSSEEVKSVLRKMKVLVAEDNINNQFVIREFLQGYVADIKFVVNGNEFIHDYKSNNYDIALLDIQMPDLDGFSAMIELQKDDIAHIPVFALSGDFLESKIEEARSLGLAGFIAKPVNRKSLLHSLAYCKLGKLNKFHITHYHK